MQIRCSWKPRRRETRTRSPRSCAATRPGSTHFALTLTANPADAEDLAQETFIRAFRGLHRFRGDSSFKNWLYRIAANAAHTRRGKQLRHAAIWDARVESDEVSERHLASAAESVELRAIRRQVIDRALAALTPDQRAAVVLHDHRGIGIPGRLGTCWISRSAPSCRGSSAHDAGCGRCSPSWAIIGRRMRQSATHRSPRPRLHHLRAHR